MRKIFYSLAISFGILLSGFFVGQSIFATENEIYVFKSDNEQELNQKTVTISPTFKYVLDDETLIFLKAEQGQLYVTIDGDYLEIINNVEIVSQYYKYSIKFIDCKTHVEFSGDVGFAVIDSCDVSIKREPSTDIRNNLTHSNFEKRIDLESRFKKAVFEVNNVNGNFVKLRFLEADVKYTDRETFFIFTKSFDSNFDIITNYGVKNIKLDKMWQNDFVILGPYKIHYTLLDVANGHIRCWSSCQDTFDIEIQAELISDPKDFPIKIVEYNSELTKIPKLIETRDIPHDVTGPRFSMLDLRGSAYAKTLQDTRSLSEYGELVLSGETKTFTLHCDSDEYALRGFADIPDKYNEYDNFRFLSKNLIVHDPDSSRGKSWVGNTSWEVVIVNNEEKKASFYSIVNCKKINSEKISHQIALGVPEDKLSCWYDFVLIENKNKNKFACVKAESANKIISRGWGSMESLQSNEYLADVFMANKPIIYAQGELVYDEDPKWSGSHYRLVPERIFGIPWDQINEDKIVIHQEGITDDLLDKKVRIKGIFIPDFTIHDYLFNSCYKCDESGPGLIIEEIDLMN